jgi:hypothetical protein
MRDFITGFQGVKQEECQVTLGFFYQKPYKSEIQSPISKEMESQDLQAIEIRWGSTFTTDSSNNLIFKLDQPCN